MTDNALAVDLRRLADSLLTLVYDTWDFGVSVAFEALVVASEVLDDERYAAYARGWCRAWAADPKPFERADCTAPGHAIVKLATRYGDAHLFEAACRLADYLLARPKLGGVFVTSEHAPLVHPCGGAPLDAKGARLVANPPNGVFVDCLHFDPPFLVALGIATEYAVYVEEGVEQALGYVRLLQTPSGLFDHFVLRGEPDRYGHGWGRGQGWALLGLLDVIRTLESAAEWKRRFEAQLRQLRASAEALLSALARSQRVDGHWFAIVDDHDSGDEHSTAAFVAYGIEIAREVGLATDLSRVVEERALNATRQAIDDESTLTEVSAAVMACTEISHYRHVPRGIRVPWGQGPATLAIAMALKRGEATDYDQTNGIFRPYEMRGQA